MKAIVQDTYGSADVLELRDIDRPAIGDDEVLVAVRAAGVDPGVWHLMTGVPYLMRVSASGCAGPKVPVRGLGRRRRGRGRRRRRDPVPAGRRGVRHLPERVVRRVRDGPRGPAGGQAART